MTFPAFAWQNSAFLEGLSRTIDPSFIFNFEDESTEKYEDDSMLLSDWYVIGKDIKIAMNQYGKEKSLEAPKED